MLFDLTGISGQRVSQVDSLKLGSRHWIRTSDLGILAAGMFAGAVMALPLRMIFGGIWMFLLAPVVGVVALSLFSRRRSEGGEVNRRRFDRLLDSRRSLHGCFVMPGVDGPFDPNSAIMVEAHDHPVWPDAAPGI